MTIKLVKLRALLSKLRDRTNVTGELLIQQLVAYVAAAVAHGKVRHLEISESARYVVTPEYYVLCCQQRSERMLQLMMPVLEGLTLSIHDADALLTTAADTLLAAETPQLRRLEIAFSDTRRKKSSIDDEVIQTLINLINGKPGITHVVLRGKEFSKDLLKECDRYRLKIEINKDI